MMCEINSKVTMKTPEQRRWTCFGVLIVKFEQTSLILLGFPLLPKAKLKSHKPEISSLRFLIKKLIHRLFQNQRGILWNQLLTSSLQHRCPSLFRALADIRVLERRPPIVILPDLNFDPRLSGYLGPCQTSVSKVINYFLQKAPSQMFNTPLRLKQPQTLLSSNLQHSLKSQLASTCPKSTLETVEKGVKYFQS